MEIFSKVITIIAWTIGNARNSVTLVPGTHFYRTLDPTHPQVKMQLDALIDAGLIRIPGAAPLTVAVKVEENDVRGSAEPASRARRRGTANKSDGGIPDARDADKKDAETSDSSG